MLSPVPAAGEGHRAAPGAPRRGAGPCHQGGRGPGGAAALGGATGVEDWMRSLFLLCPELLYLLHPYSATAKRSSSIS